MESEVKSNCQKIHHTVESMKEQMKISEEEKIYRTENFSDSTLNEYVKYFKCTKCGVSFWSKINKGKDITVHPLLEVLMCSSCCDYYGDGNFSLDSDGEDKYCRWCGEGGTIFSCSKCICAFCDKCIKKHFNEGGLTKVQNDDDWVCYFCDPKPLWYLRSICSLALETSLKNKIEKEKKDKENMLLPSSSRKGRLGKEINNMCDNTSESCKSSVAENNKEGKRKKLRKTKPTCYIDFISSSSENEKENSLELKKSRFRRGRKLELDGSKESARDELRNPKKRQKLLTDENSSEKADENSAEKMDEDSSEKVKDSKTVADRNKNLVLDKIKGIWKMTQIVTEIGFNSSKERLERLSNLARVKTVQDVWKEYEKLKSVMLMLSSSINKANDFADALKEDLNCQNVKDESHIFRNEEAKLKSLGKKLQEDSENDNSEKNSTDDSCSESEFGGEKKSKSGSEEQRRKIKKSCKTEESNSNGTKLNKKKRVSAMDSGMESVKEFSFLDKNLDTRKDESMEGEKTCPSGVTRPMLKVKSFARMTDENIFDHGKTVKASEASENVNEGKSEASENVTNSQNHDDEYNAETEASSEDQIQPVRKTRRKKKKSSGSNFSEDAREIQNEIRKIKRDKSKLKESFEKFKKKRERYLRSVKESNDVEKTNEGKRSRILESSDEDCEKSKSNAGASKKLHSSDDDLQVAKSGTNKSDEGSEKNDEDASISSTSSSETEAVLRKRKVGYRRIKDTSTDKESSKSGKEKSGNEKEEEAEAGGTNKKKRKNIKKILKKDSLQLETKEALKCENDRKRRLEEKKKLMNKIFPEESDESGIPKRVILDFDPDTKEALVTVHKKLLKKLKPHQIEGIRFMWNNCFESVKRLEEETGSGCILAHCMGLGKTLQVIALVHTVMTHELGVNTVLVICPMTTVANWINEFEYWLRPIRTEPIVLYDMQKYKKNEERSFYLEEWHKTGGVLVLSYDLFRNLTKSSKMVRKKYLKIFEQFLLDPGPDLVICDEGHLLKNEDTALSKCVNRIKTARRIVLTGTPLQNNLIEYHCMVQFVKPNILGTKKEFSNRFVNPITNGQFEDSTEDDVRLMKRRSHVLHCLLNSCVQRCDYSVLTPFLPEKQEYVLSISLTETQINVYKHYIKNISSKITSKSAKLFNDYHVLQRVWTHPRALLLHSRKESERDLEDDSEGSLRDFVVNTDEEDGSSGDGTTSSESNKSDVVPKKRLLRSNANDPDIQRMIEDEEKEKNQVKDWWSEFYNENDFEDIRAGNKLMILFSLLKRFGEMDDKVLVFSQSLYSLDVIEYFLGKIDDNSDGNDEVLGEFRDSWTLGVDYFRLDGSTNADLRKAWCDNFNENSNRRARLFLISTRAGGLGINLCGANRVVVFDASWNPSHDLQSIFRVYRFGQNKTCYVYRFVSEATMEEKIYERQVTKLSLAHRVVDEHQIERHYSMLNLQELYRFEPTPPEKREIPKLPRDKVLADILSTYKNVIVRYHEHDSLLENQQEEELTEEERKAAWKDFEEEKMKQFQSQSANFTLLVQNQMPNINLPHSNVMVINPTPDGNNQMLLNPMYMYSSIPLPMLQRGLLLGLSPTPNESSESFMTRVINKELFLASCPRET